MYTSRLVLGVYDASMRRDNVSRSISSALVFGITILFSMLYAGSVCFIRSHRSFSLFTHKYLNFSYGGEAHLVHTLLFWKHEYFFKFVVLYII